MQSDSRDRQCYVSVIKEISNGVTTSVKLDYDHEKATIKPKKQSKYQSNGCGCPNEDAASNYQHNTDRSNKNYPKQNGTKKAASINTHTPNVTSLPVSDRTVSSTGSDNNVREGEDKLDPQKLDRANSVESLDAWGHAWKTGLAGWHKGGIHELLNRHFRTLSGQRNNLKIFFPLCGKAVDMKWLADMGHTVVGVEGVSFPLEEFLEENDVAYTVTHHQLINGSVYQSNEGNIRLYRCDILDFNSSLEGHFDAIWDRGALTALFPPDRERYINLLLNMMAPGCHYLLTTVDYDTTNHNTSPYVIPKEELCKLYGHYCNIRQIDEISEERNAARDIACVREKLYHITFKSPGC